MEQGLLSRERLGGGRRGRADEQRFGVSEEPLKKAFVKKNRNNEGCVHQWCQDRGNRPAGRGSESRQGSRRPGLLVNHGMSAVATQGGDGEIKLPCNVLGTHEVAEPPAPFENESSFRRGTVLVTINVSSSPRPATRPVPRNEGGLARTGGEGKKMTPLE